MAWNWLGWFRTAGQGSVWLSPRDGSGLGLTICRGLVEAHGGEIAVEATPVGACVRVTLPVEPLLSDGGVDHVR